MEIKIDLDELRKRKLFLATPMYGGMCIGTFARSCMDLSVLCAQNGIPLQVHFLFNESLITRARNYCCDEFMRSECEHMIFIDSDIGFNPHDIIAMMALQAQHDDYDIIGAAYPKKCISWEKIKHAVDKGMADKNPEVLGNFVGDFVFNPKARQTQIALGEPAEVLEIGTGFMMITKNALKKFNEAYPQYLYKPDHVRTEHFDGSREIMMYFQAEVDQPDPASYYRNEMARLVSMRINDPDILEKEIDSIVKKYSDMREQSSKRYLSEDYWFCQKAHAIGLKTWLCPWMKLTHSGSYIFGGSLADMAALGVSATADPNMLKKGK